jgi:glycosyltransferase involved in cell wall biosynthesis
VKLALITNIPNPYRIPLFNTLSEKLKERGISLEVIFASYTYSRRKFEIDESSLEFNYTILESQSKEVKNSEGVLFNFKNLLSHLKKIKPDYIIVSGFSIATLKVIWYTLLRRKIKTIIWSGATKKRKEKKARKIFRSLVAQFFNGFIAYGSQAKDYLKHLGVDERKISIAINTVDTQFFSKQQTQAVKEKGDKFVLTAMGYLTKRKNFAPLIQLVKSFLKVVPNVHLQIIGDGPERETLEKLAKQSKVEDLITFNGFKQKNEIPHFLYSTDVFLFQTNFDIWGLVLNEAMAARCCCLASINAGSTHDLIEHGENGYMVDFEDQSKVLSILKKLSSDPDLVNKIGTRAKETITTKASIIHSVEGFLQQL